MVVREQARQARHDPRRRAQAADRLPVRGRQGLDLGLHGRLRARCGRRSRPRQPPPPAAAAVAADLGTITRADGTKQVTYKGHPLYFFAKDKDAGDAYGQGVKSFGADWYVLKPSGDKVDDS